MLVIRKEQRKKLSKYMADSFEDKLLLHFKEFFPKHFKMLGKETMQNTIHHGVQVAAAYDVSSRREVCYYISMMLMFGSDFDRDPQLPWAAELLNDRSLDHHPDRVELVFQRALEYLDKVAVPEKKSRDISIIQAERRT